jgi:hypothetical protein
VVCRCKLLAIRLVCHWIIECFMRNSSTSVYTQICLSHMQLYSDLAILLAFPPTTTNLLIISLNISYWLTVFDWKCELCFIELYFKMFQLNYTSLNNQVTWKLRKDTWTHGTNFKHDFLINLARIKDICSMERKYHYHVWFKENVVRYLI